MASTPSGLTKRARARDLAEIEEQARLSKIVQLRADALSCNEIAKQLSMDPAQVRRIVGLPEVREAVQLVLDDAKQYALLHVATRVETALEVYDGCMGATESEPMPDHAFKAAKDILDRVGATVEAKGSATTITNAGPVLQITPELLAEARRIYAQGGPSAAIEVTQQGSPSEEHPARNLAGPSADAGRGDRVLATGEEPADGER